MRYHLLALSVIATTISVPSLATETLEIDVETDTYVRNGDSSDQNFSTAENLQTVNSDKEQSELILRFVIPKSSLTADSASIWIRSTSGETHPVENAAYIVPDNTWNAKTITWNNKPAYGEEIDAWVTAGDHTIRIDVTRQVIAAAKEDGQITIAVRSPNNVGADGRSIYHSLETPGAFSSKLLIRYDETKEYVLAGESIQKALDAVHKKGGGQVILSRGKHYIDKSLVVHSNTTLRGVGAEYTTILLDHSTNEPMLVSGRAGRTTSDVSILDLTLDGQQKPSEQNYPGDSERKSLRGDSFGIFFTDQESGNKFERLRIQNVKITRCAMGIHCKGVNDIRILDSEIRGNGCLIGYDHNIYFRRARNALLKNLNISDCTAGNGFNLSTDCTNVVIDRCIASNNFFRGIRFEANDGGSRMMILNSTTNNNGRKEKQPGIRVANVRDFKVINNTANDNGANGILIMNSRNGLVRGNAAKGNAKADYDMNRSRDVVEEENR